MSQQSSLSVATKMDPAGRADTEAPKGARVLYQPPVSWEVHTRALISPELPCARSRCISELQLPEDSENRTCGEFFSGNGVAQAQREKLERRL